MINPKRFVNFVIIGTILFPLLLVAAYSASKIKLPELLAWESGWVIIFTGFAFELLLINRGLLRSDKSFMRNVLGAISIRLIITLMLVIICLIFLELNQNTFIFSILIFYFFYLIIEIFYLNFRIY
jgi:hypothetical protein